MKQRAGTQVPAHGARSSLSRPPQRPALGGEPWFSAKREPAFSWVPGAGRGAFCPLNSRTQRVKGLGTLALGLRNSGDVSVGRVWRPDHPAHRTLQTQGP